ncbi:MAG: hypothetical protein B6245_23295 [Desulfobacteraceae bacterium 4572_88]|nr:MAG: hypothetical protein B6245_23295 [Desulfobacteraceae bacterium 4572_88]
MKKIFYIILALILSGPGNADAFEVRIHGDKLSIHADHVPLQSILQRMADMGITVQIDPQLNPKISASFENRDIQKGLLSILRPLNHVLIWESDGKSRKTRSAERTGKSVRLAEIQVFRPGKKDLMERLNEFSVAKNPKDGSLYVRDEILLKLSPKLSPSVLETLVARIGGTVLEKNEATGVYRIRLPENTDVLALADLIGKNPGIGTAEPNYVYPISAPQGNVFASAFDESDRIMLPDGTVPIAVLDTGLTADSGMDDLVPASLDALNPGDSISDSLGHGTQMALIASGVITPHGAEEDSETLNPVIPIRIFDDNGLTSNFSIMRSIDFALENGARVMSLSWSSETKSEFLENALDNAASNDLIVVAAAGNEPTGKEVWPAAYPSVIGVGALNPEGEDWEKSNYGNFVSLSAPGFATLPVGYKGDPGAYAGTSISTAYVANTIADYLSKNPEATFQDVLDSLKDLF